ncbi:MAG: GNAT family N-acetyltransferase [Cytophagales bacterium]|nr:GNAT family N-acetyltransferase [Armatimonadota bacterium]
MDDALTLRALRPDEWSQVADLIHRSTNAWYVASGKAAIFTGDPADCELYPRVYEALDPGCCIVAVAAEHAGGTGGSRGTTETGRTRQTERIVGSCFYHPRATHFSIGIVNVHPDHFGRGIAHRMLHAVIEKADGENKPLRLVSSAMNLDSFSLYTRAGFVPRQTYQDMWVAVPPGGIGAVDPAVRSATTEDVPAMAALERMVSGLERERDYHHFLENADGIWHASVLPARDGKGLDGFLVSIAAPASNLLGPGIARTDHDAATLIRAELNHHRGRTPVFLVPADRPELVGAMYALGARNCELHFAQVRGAWTPPAGIVMPTFMPETG